ncbi:MAG: ATP-binding protein [Candidatus Binatia bacterium]
MRTTVTSGRLHLDVLDNGPGIVGIDANEIWLPGYTTKPGGTGLGLTIVRDAAQDLGGSVAVEERGELGGATFHIELPILGV